MTDYRRSPRYPALNLSVAINGAHLLWTKCGRNAFPGEALAKALGYKSHSGPSRTMIGAMRQYGLLEKQGRGLRLSESAILIVGSPEGTREQVAAIRNAALAPDLFRDLYATHRGESADAIKSYLTLRRGFTELGAALAASAFRDTLSLAKLTESGARSGDIAAAGEGNTRARVPAKESERDVSPGGAIPHPGPKGDDSLLTQSLVVSIPRNFTVDVSVHGDRIGKEDLPRIKNQLDRWIEGLEDAFE